MIAQKSANVARRPFNCLIHPNPSQRREPIRMSPVELAALESAEVILGLNNPFVPARDTAITGAPSLLFLSWTDLLATVTDVSVEGMNEPLL